MKDTNKCICFENYWGQECKLQRFSSFCNNKGYMIYTAYYEKKCICDKNSYGDVNILILKTSHFLLKKCQFSRCQGNGDYISGKFCRCYLNYGGENCEVKLVDDECSNLGISFLDLAGKKK